MRAHTHASRRAGTQAYTLAHNGGIREGEKLKSVCCRDHLVSKVPVDQHEALNLFLVPCEKLRGVLHGFNPTSGGWETGVSLKLTGQPT